MKKILSLCLVALFSGAMLFANGSSEEASFPVKPIKAIVPYGAGGGADITIRLLGKYLEPNLGKDVVVQNVSGGSGTIGWTQLVNSKNDGYTISYGDCIMSNDELLFEGISYDDNSFTPISMYASDPHILVVSKKLGISTFEELIEYVKANPDSVTYGLGGAWTSHDFLRLNLQNTIGVNFKRMVFQNGAAAVNAVAGDNCMIATPFISEALAQIEAGNVIPLAVSSEERIEVLPEVPTMKEGGVDLVHTMWRGLFGPADMDAEAVKVIDAAMAKVLSNKDYIAEAKATGSFPEYMEYAKFKDYFHENHNLYKTLIEQGM